MKNYRKVLLIAVIIIAAFIGGFFVFNRKTSTETSTKGVHGFEIKSDKSNGVKLYLLDASTDSGELYLNYDVEFGDHGKGIDYDSVSFGSIFIRESNKANSDAIRGTQWSTNVNKEFNKINIQQYSEIEGKLGKKLRLNIEDIILKKRKKITKKLDFNDDSIEIEVNNNIIEKIVLKKPKVYGDEMVVEADIYNKNDKGGIFMEIYHGDERLDSTRSESIHGRENIVTKKTIFILGNHEVKNLVLKMNYEEEIKEIKGKWSVDFEVDKNIEINNTNQTKKIKKKVNLGEYSFSIDKAEKNLNEINVYTSDLKSSLEEKYFAEWKFHKVDFIYPKHEVYQHTWVDSNFNDNKKEAVMILGLLDKEMRNINLDDLKLNIKSIEKQYRVREDYSECNLITLKDIRKEEKMAKIELKGEPVEIKYKRVGENIELELISDIDKLQIHLIQLLDKEGKYLQEDKDNVETMIFKGPLDLKNKYVQPIILKGTELEELNFVISDYSEIVNINKVIDLE